jgi:hypothetical protein
LLSLLTIIPSLAQVPETADSVAQKKRPWEISLLLGKTSGGPAKDLEAAMISSGFNGYYPGFPGVAPPQDYPYSETGFGKSEFSVDLNVRYADGSLLYGGIVSYNPLGMTAGYKSPSHFVDLDYSVVAVAPTVGILLEEILRLGVGPALYFCSCSASTPYGEVGSTSETKLGLIVDAGLVFPAKTRFFVDLAFQYRLVGDATVGPFQDVYGSSVATFPATEASFNHAFIALGMGVRF